MFIPAGTKDRRSGFIVSGPDVEPLPVRVCDIRCASDLPYGDAEATAQLISAAPELLAALETLLEHAQHAQWHPDNSFMRNAREAIAKAKGTK